MEVLSGHNSFISFSKRKLFLLGAFLLFINSASFAQTQSIARTWNEVLLHAIRTDFARPTVHARNLYHLSAAHYDCLAAYTVEQPTFLLGKEINGFNIPFEGVSLPNHPDSAKHEAICYASYRLLNHRFQNSPGYTGVLFKMDSLMSSHNYPVSDTTTNYLFHGPSALGNYIASQIIQYGLQDGSNEANNYENIYYEAANAPIEVEQPGNPLIEDPNRWQAISLTTSIDQSGNEVASTPPHLSPEWGNVDPFAMSDTLISTFNRDGHDYQVYVDPGEPAYIDTTDTLELNSLYKWNHCMVSVWQSHLDPANGIMIDISPASRGNLTYYPQTKEDHPLFYDYFNGGVQQPTGHSLNPITGSPYAPQIVPLGDYARVLAEFWADGIDSETPPGHWFEILHSVIDDPQFVKQWMAQGDTLSLLEYDIYAHFALGGAMHDAAVAAWSVKGWYDYLRPVSAIRLMAKLGQSSDTNQVNFHPGGIPLIPGYIELVQAGDPLEGSSQEHIGKVKLYTWKGPDYISDPETDIAGVGWILAENWWPYQRPTFVTPPFAGYVSGHSTFSRTAANVLTFMTGSPYFPGGIGEFHAEQNEFLEFEDGPSVDITLQWATYQDAADECSLSRIWGGIHPPVDDIPGRLMGDEIGVITFDHANHFISSKLPRIHELLLSDTLINISDIGDTLTIQFIYDTLMDISIIPAVEFIIDNPTNDILNLIDQAWLNDSIFELKYEILNETVTYNFTLLQIDSARTIAGNYQNVHLFGEHLYIDTRRPLIASFSTSDSIINDGLVGNTFHIDIIIDETCDTSSTPSILFTNTIAANTLQLDGSSSWVNDSTYSFIFNVLDSNVILDSILIETTSIIDYAGNSSLVDSFDIGIRIDTREPHLIDFTINDTLLNTTDIGFNALSIDLTFDKKMDTGISPDIIFLGDSIFNDPFTNSIQSSWSTDTSCTVFYHLTSSPPLTSLNTSILLDQFSDLSGNTPSPDTIYQAFILDTQRPFIDSIIPENRVVYDGNTGLNNFYCDVYFSEVMNTNQLPNLTVLKNSVSVPSFQYNPFNSSWENDSVFKAQFNVNDDNVEIDSLAIAIKLGEDAQFNQQLSDTLANIIDLDTKNPSTNIFSANTYAITNSTGVFSVVMVFDESMDENILPSVGFSDAYALTALSADLQNSQWYNDLTYEQVFTLNNVDLSLQNIIVTLQSGKDRAGNSVMQDTLSSPLNIELNYLDVPSVELNEYAVFPNPVIKPNKLSILFPNANDETLLQIHDMLGRINHSEWIAQGEKVVTIDVTKLSAGPYLLTIESNGAIYQHKIVIR